MVSHHGGRRVAAGDQNGVVASWDADTGLVAARFAGHADGIVSLAVSDDGSKVASVSFDDTIKIWELGSGQELASATVNWLDVTAIGFSPDGSRLVSAGKSPPRVWDAMDLTLLLTLREPEGEFRSLSFSNDGTRLVAADASGDVRVWSARRNESAE